MSAEQPAVPIRLLVDQSKDAHSSGCLVPLEPDDCYATTRTWEPVTAELLRNYDVLAVCGSSPLPYTPEELDAIKAFVRGGGGLLLAANAAAFEARALRPAAEMSAGEVAARWGVRFLSPQEAQGLTRIGDSMVRGYDRAALVLLPHAATGALGGEEFPAWPCAPLAAPEDAEALLQHRETGEAIGVALTAGEGRVIVMADTAFAQTRHPLPRHFVEWLAAGRYSRQAGSETIPDTIGGVGGLKRLDEVTYAFEPGLEDQVPRIAELRRRVVEHLKPCITDHWKPPTTISIMRTCTGPEWRTPWWGHWEAAPAQADDAIIVMMLAGRFWLQCLWSLGLGRAPHATFGSALSAFLSLRTMAALGYTEPAAELRDALLGEAEQTPAGYDMTRAYEEFHAKGFWALHQLHERYGDDLMERFVKALPEGDKSEGLPLPFAREADVVAYCLSLAVGEDLFPWFAEIGCQVHPLPLVRKGDEGFAAAMRGCAEQGLQDRALPTSDRLDAVEALATLNRKDEGQPPATERLTADDPLDRLVAAFELMRAADERGRETLRALTGSDDEPLQAMAALVLARAGDSSVGEQLLALAPRQDVRFALDAGHALEPLGTPGRQALTLDELTMADGTKPGGWETYWDGASLRIWPIVEGYKVANIFSEAALQHFPHNAHINRLYVQYVHTDPRFRRKGLSRATMARVFAHPALKRCSCAALGTGTRNVAHTLYRSFGFTDWSLRGGMRHELSTAVPCRIPEGVVLRGTRAGDEQAIADLVAACEGARSTWGRPRAEPPPAQHLLKLAERDGELIGIASARPEGEEAYFGGVSVKEGSDRHDVAVALLSAVHADLRTQRAQSVMRWDAPPTGWLAAALAAAGYLPRHEGGVEMWALLDLPKLLGEIAPLLERRLAESTLKGWTGCLDLVGGKHRARLAFTEGKLTVAAIEGSSPGLVLTCDDDTLTRVVSGVETPFEAYLQTRLTIAPQVNDQIVSLLEALFPAVARR